MSELKKYMIIKSPYDNTKAVWRYIDDLDEAKSYWYVAQAIEKYGVESMMPIVMNKHGGYHPHKPDEPDVVAIIESVDWPDLKAWEMYPCNRKDFRTGWIAPNGDTYSCSSYEHIDCAAKLARQFYGEQTRTGCDSFLLGIGWFKCTNKKYTGWMRRMSDAQAKYFLDHDFQSKYDCGSWRHSMVKTRTEAEAALTIARRELNRAVHDSETYQNPGLAKIAANKAAWLSTWLSTLISMAESRSNFYWVSCDLIMPENVPENAGKKVIPCIVSIKSRYPNGKPNIQKRMRQFRRYPELHWEWSQSNKDRITHWAALPNPPEV